MIGDTIHKKDFAKLWYLWGVCLAVGVALLATKVHWLTGYVIGGMAVGVPLLIQATMNPKFGIYLMVGIAYFLNVFRMLIPSLPVGLIMDFLILIMTLSCWLRDLSRKNFEFFKSPLTSAILIWIGWHLLELMNPEAASRVAWFYVMRPVVGYIMLFFITYHYMNTKQDIKKMLLFIWLLSFISAVWGLKQYFHDYFGFEMDFMVESEIVRFVYIQGRWRCFGTLGSPAQFGVGMSFAMMLSFVLFWAKIGWEWKTFILIGVIAIVMGLIYSGTRTGIAMIPVGIIVIVVLARNKKLSILTIVGGAMFWGVMQIPTNNYHLKRIQSTFNSEEDASYQVRKENREIITPYILSHPMGGGLGSTGVWGNRFSPGTFLANFPPDSGYMRVAVEMGWVGLLIYLFLWIKIIWSTIIGYYNIRDSEMKWFAMSILASTLPLAVVEYTQDIIGKLPFNLLFWVLTAMAYKANEIGSRLPEDKTDGQVS
ncbi:O-antigen ligase family protein [Limibacter armeniacum]|uniref:O-antigen ligase family protein n=1 Tax=Limibacter armeniacum TaxID=466084 RepID=UPI002FE649FB